MKYQIFILMFLLSSFQIAFSQTKTIEGDTAYLLKSNKILLKKLGLRELEKSDDEFNFRFRNDGQVIEITKDSFSVQGSITNYVYHTRRAKSKSDTLSNKIILSPEQAKDIYNFVQSSTILNIPSDNKIEKWNYGADGITYIIEHADKKTYWVKKYWTPSAQDSIPEALIVLNFIKKLSDALNLKETYTAFRNNLPASGCYTSEGIVITCYSPNPLELGYSGSTKLPLGFYTSYGASYIGKTKVNSSIALQYNFDNSGLHHLHFQAAKWDIFYGGPNFYDFVIYNYQNRKLNIDDGSNKFENHQIAYGFNLKNNFGVGAGLDYLKNDDEQVGGHLYASKWFSKLKVSTVLTSSLFGNQLNYKAEIHKPFYLNQRSLIRQISLRLAYEKFLGYKDFYFGCQFTL